MLAFLPFAFPLCHLLAIVQNWKNGVVLFGQLYYDVYVVILDKNVCKYSLFVVLCAPCS
jgi:hypothetical protein